MTTCTVNSGPPDRKRLLSMGAFSYTAPTTTEADAALAATMAKARRKRVSSAVHDYLKELSSMARVIVLEKEALEHKHREIWGDMNDEKKEELMNEYFIPSGVRAHYEPEYACEHYSPSLSSTDTEADDLEDNSTTTTEGAAKASAISFDDIISFTMMMSA